MVDRLQQISSTLECQYGLLTKLHRLLTERQISEIKAQRTEFDKNDKLTEFLSLLLNDVDTSAEFLAALRNTGQGHLANYITGCK